MRSNSYEAFAELAKKHIPEDCYFINPRRPDRTAAQFLDWYGGQQRSDVVSTNEMRGAIFNFLDTAAWWKTSVRGPVRGGPRDHLIMPFCPSTRDINRVAQALRQAF